MKKSAGVWLGGAVLLLLAACVQKDPDPVGPGTGTEVGKAEILLPALPQGFLLNSARSGPAADPFFILTITGPGMAPRKHAWPLSSAGGTAVTVENIPVGKRLFTGEIEAGGSILYADSVWTPIEGSKTALVRLRLGRTTGNAKVCVEIEGLPPPTGCPGRDSLPDVDGCWTVHGTLQDSAHPPRLRIFQRDSILQAVLTWPQSGAMDTAQGYATDMGHVYLDGDFLFGGSIDPSTGNPVGKFFHRLGTPLPAKRVTLHRSSCDSVVPPVDSSLTCYDVAQVLDGKSNSGRLALLQRNLALYGHFQWKGYQGMPVDGKAGHVFENLALYLYGRLPPGLAQDTLGDDMHYKAQRVPDGTLQYGTLYGTDTGYVARGTWKGSTVACRPEDREIIRAAHGL